MSSSLGKGARIVQKERTRQSLIDAARALLDQGVTPTVEQAAEGARVSRPTAYRYFRTRHDLLVAAHPELAIESLLPHAPPTDPVARLDVASNELMRLLLTHETALRAMFRISADIPPELRPPLALRSGRRIRWIQDALQPVRTKLKKKRFHRLVLQIGATLGIEPLMWLIDIARVERKEAAEILRASARELLKAALAEP